MNQTINENDFFKNATLTLFFTLDKESAFRHAPRPWCGLLNTNIKEIIIK